MLILVVDDEDLVRGCLVQAFRCEGHDVIEAASVRAALSAVSSRPANTAVVDLMLPDGSGVDLVSQLQSTHPEIRCVVLTGFGTIQTAIAATRAGAVDYLCKPVNHRELLARLDPQLRDGVPREIGEAQMTLEQARWDFIQRTLAATNQNISETARRLGIRRQSLQRMLKKHPPSSMV